MKNMSVFNNVLMITNEDGSVTCIPFEGATEQEKQMFIDFQEMYPEEKSQPQLEVNIEDIINAKISQLQDLYNQIREAGFKSSANTEEFTFRYGQADQIEFLKLMMGANMGVIPSPMGVPAIEGVAIYEQEQLPQLFKDASAFDLTLSTKYQTLLAEIKDCSTVDEVDAIEISFD